VNPEDAAPENAHSADEALVPRLEVIEGQPLEARAAAYAQLHDELRDRLQGGDTPRSANG
jgi:hypothetical protein